MQSIGYILWTQTHTVKSRENPSFHYLSLNLFSFIFLHCHQIQVFYMVLELQAHTSQFDPVSFSLLQSAPTKIIPSILSTSSTKKKKKKIPSKRHLLRDLILPENRSHRSVEHPKIGQTTKTIFDFETTHASMRWLKFQKPFTRLPLRRNHQASDLPPPSIDSCNGHHHSRFHQLIYQNLQESASKKKPRDHTRWQKLRSADARAFYTPTHLTRPPPVKNRHISPTQITNPQLAQPVDPILSF